MKLYNLKKYREICNKRMFTSLGQSTHPWDKVHILGSMSTSPMKY